MMVTRIRGGILIGLKAWIVLRLSSRVRKTRNNFLGFGDHAGSRNTNVGVSMVLYHCIRHILWLNRPVSSYASPNCFPLCSLSILPNFLRDPHQNFLHTIDDVPTSETMSHKRETNHVISYYVHLFESIYLQCSSFSLFFLYRDK